MERRRTSQLLTGPSTLPWMDVARAELGVAEAPGGSSNPRVLGYLSSCRGSRRLLQRDSTPWCSAFVNWVLKQAGYERTRSLAARSWLRYGDRCVAPQRGAIAVLWRGVRVPATIINAPGHVGFVERWDDSHIWLLGGNQGDRVSVRPYPRSRVLQLVWPSESNDKPTVPDSVRAKAQTVAPTDAQLRELERRRWPWSDRW